MPKGALFSGEFKQMVVEDLRKNHLSYSETMRKYGIAGKASIQNWERIYLEEGIEGLYTDRRGRGSSGRPAKQMTRQTEEDLISENQRLRAENDYLKKLNALVSERVQREKRHR
jgi:transposase